MSKKCESSLFDSIHGEFIKKIGKRRKMSYYIRKIIKITTEGESAMKNVYKLIRRLGITSKYKGYYFVAEAVRISMEQQEYPIKITKDIYPHLAKKFKSTPMNVEHDIRTIINVCWETNRDAMDVIAGYSLSYKPMNSEFVDMLAYYLSQNDTVTVEK